MLTLTSQTQGYDRATRHLAALEQALGGEALETAAMAGALPIVNAAKQNAPYRSVTLRRSIHPQVLESGHGRAVVSVGSNVPYARRIEYGFVAADARGRRYHQPAQPYLRPAADDNRQKALEEARAVVAQLVARAVR